MAEELNSPPATGTEAVNFAYDRPAAGAARREREVERATQNLAHSRAEDCGDHDSLSLGEPQRTSRRMPPLFDMNLRAIRRDRAARIGVELFLFERAFADCLERLALAPRKFERALLIGCPDPHWAGRLRAFAGQLDVCDPGPLFAADAGGQPLIEDAWEAPPGAFDLVIAIGTFDSINDLPLALRLVRHPMRPDSLLLGAVSGGDTLPKLRQAMRAADAIAGVAAPHVHPRIEASALAPLLETAGFVRPVIDVDRVAVSYRALDRLVADLRAMGATNVLTARPPFVGRAALAAASQAFVASGENSRTTEIFEILHFAAWTAKQT